MELTGKPFAWLMVALAVAGPLVLALTWRGRPHGVLGGALRFVGVLICQVLAVLAVFAVVNSIFGFFASWDDLLGTHGENLPPPDTAGLVAADGSQGRITTFAVGGGRSGASAEVTAWLPPQYDAAVRAGRRLPALMLLTGYPGSPGGVFKQFDIGVTASAAIARGDVPPFVVIVPPITIAPPRDTECTNVPRGPQAETWLADDVRDAAIRRFGLAPAPQRWAAAGWSTGGFCSAKLALRRPDAFGASVAMGGYYDALLDSSTGDLYGGDVDRRHQNSPRWLVRNGRAGDAHLLVVASRQDINTWIESKNMIDAAAAARAERIESIVLAEGGHRFTTYAPALTSGLQWLGRGPFGR